MGIKRGARPSARSAKMGRTKSGRKLGIHRLFAIGRIRTRLLIGFGLIGVLLVAVAAAGFYSTNSIAQTAEEVISEQFPRTIALDDLRSGILIFGNYADLAMMNAAEGNAGRIPNHVQRMERSVASVEADFLALREGDSERGIRAVDDTELIGQLDETHAAWNELRISTNVAVKTQLDEGGYIIDVDLDVGDGGARVAGVSDLENLEIRREKTMQLLDGAQEMLSEQVARAIDQVTLAQQLALVLALAATGIGLALAVLIALGVAGSITLPLHQAVGFATAVASGDYEASIERHTRDEIGELTSTVAQMKDSLVARMTQLRNVADAVAAAADSLAEDSERIADATRQLHEGADGQSAAADETSASIEELAVSIDQVAEDAESLGASAEETAATMGQMSASVEQIARSMGSLSDTVAQTSSSIEEMISSIDSVAELSKDVTEASHRALDAVGTGGSAVDEMIETVDSVLTATEKASSVMNGLADQVSMIGKITETIDDIAEQTNLLALNAAIEAARAGEHGRGFAVVAEAVRDLAGRAAVSTQEITGLVESITHDTQGAVSATGLVLEQASGSGKLAKNVQKALADISHTFDEVAASMTQVERATTEQAQGGGQVIDAVAAMSELHKQMDEAMQEQAMGSGRVVAAAEDMSARIGRVAMAMGEQKRGGEQMVVAMESIAKTTRGTLGATAELASASSSLASQSENLRVLVQGFSLDGAEGEGSEGVARELEEQGADREITAAENEADTESV